MSELIPPNSRPLTGPAPRTKVPAGAIDTHMHFFLEGFAAQPDGPPIKQLAEIADYAQVQKRLGLDRVIITQGNAYQFNNGATLEAQRRLGTDRARSIVVVSADTPAEELERMHAMGARGARIMDLPGGAVPVAKMAPVAKAVLPLDWIMMVQFNGRKMGEYYEALAGLENRYIIDHVARFMDPVPADDPKVDALLRLIDRGNCWFKLAAWYEYSLTGGPAFEDVAAIARRVVAHAPERIIWGTNWPHLGAPAGQYPDDAAILDLMADWVGDANLNRVLVDNPARLFGFG